MLGVSALAPTLAAARAGNPCSEFGHETDFDGDLFAVMEAATGYALYGVHNPTGNTKQEDRKTLTELRLSRNKEYVGEEKDVYDGHQYRFLDLYSLGDPDVFPVHYLNLQRERETLRFLTNARSGVALPKNDGSGCKYFFQLVPQVHYVIFFGVETGANYFPVIDLANDPLLKIVDAYFKHKLKRKKAGQEKIKE